MKMSRILSLVLVLVMLASCFVACGPKGDEQDDGGKKDNVITVWISEKAGVAELTETQIARFIKANPQYSKYTVVVEAVSESDAASQMLLDVANGADIYGFAQDQLARLVQASALAAPGKAATETVVANNDPESVEAAKVGDKLWAYPMTSDNGYFLYYDKSIVTTDPTDLAAIVADCETAGKKFSFELENGWYAASFFFGVGCRSTWTATEEGDFTKVEDNFDNLALGAIALKGMSILTQASNVYKNSSKIEDGIAAVVTGTWNANDAEEYFGENLGVSKLPKFTVDGTSYQLGSFSGFKLMGVKPQTDLERGAFCSELAQYLTSEECQTERFNQFQWGPSNKAAQDLDEVKNNESLKALAAQKAHAVPQGNIPNAWWTAAANLGAASKTIAADDDSIKIALEQYRAALNEAIEEE